MLHRQTQFPLKKAVCQFFSKLRHKRTIFHLCSLLKYLFPKYKSLFQIICHHLQKICATKRPFDWGGWAENLIGWMLFEQLQIFTKLKVRKVKPGTWVHFIRYKAAPVMKGTLSQILTPRIRDSCCSCSCCVTKKKRLTHYLESNTRADHMAWAPEGREGQSQEARRAFN